MVPSGHPDRTGQAKAWIPILEGDVLPAHRFKLFDKNDHTAPHFILQKTPFFQQLMIHI